MPSLVKSGQIVADPWQLASKAAPDYSDQTIVSLEDFEEGKHQAVWLPADTEIESVVDVIKHLELIAIEFNTFADGRGLSLASILRTRYGYRGEIRAFGHVEPDLTPFMLRSGFDAFVLEDRAKAETAIKCMSAISEHYQGSAIQPSPSYRTVQRS